MELGKMHARADGPQNGPDRFKPLQAVEATLLIARRPRCCDPWLPDCITVDKGGPFHIGLSTGPAQLLASEAASGMGTRLHQRSKAREQIAPSSCCSWSEQTDHFGMHAGRRLEGSRQGRQLMEPLKPHRF